MSEFIESLRNRINARKKMTSPLYQVIVEGKATHRLLKEFIINRVPIKEIWPRHLMGIAHRVGDYKLRAGLVENAFEEETGHFSGGGRHLNSFLNVGLALGVTPEEVSASPLMPETKALVETNLRDCNDTDVHFTQGLASVLFLMEGQPPIINSNKTSMEVVMKEVYGLPAEGYDFFTHHASGGEEDEAVSELEDEHTANVVNLLEKYCNTPELQEKAIMALENTIELRHRHFQAIYDKHYDSSEPVYRWKPSDAAGYYL
ncbi:iron-containing redox enzyme family protein [Erwinia sp. BC051422]|uniref:TenA family transcriptional regulator n=1 Tax=Erwinia wuhanensis TaxID=3045167 RepID=UPI00264B007C|nr:iron-containing redox enzyme family protein [Erwinia sp. BC051422]MDN8541826.1 iron-containing redox enzyme family protein [Erwinia sp. BC051422]